VSALSRDQRYESYQRLLRGEDLPLALIDLDLVDRNLTTLLEPVKAAGKTMRIASKSLRCLELMRYLLSKGEPVLQGIMAFSAREASFLVEQGLDDILLAYPTAHPGDAQRIADNNASGKTVAIVVDHIEQLDCLEHAAAAANTKIPVVIEVDMSYRPWGGKIHVGVRRSPLHTASEVFRFAERLRKYPHLRLDGVMGYEAQIAGLPDASPFSPRMNPIKRKLRELSRPKVQELRAEIAEGFRARGWPMRIFNGGGTGSVGWSSQERCLTEITAGSGFIDSHLFDYYRDIQLEAAVLFALQVVRRPKPGMVVCHGGGYVASGQLGPDRMPIPWLPEGLALTDLEAAGEVQTPLTVPPTLHLELGSMVFFRHAKAGELAEHFNEYYFVRGDKMVGRVPTYRGQGQAFL
jgi:D-serine deaminase-like pyridoxal phosphate-dependent protein